MTFPARWEYAPSGTVFSWQGRPSLPTIERHFTLSPERDRDHDRARVGQQVACKSQGGGQRRGLAFVGPLPRGDDAVGAGLPRRASGSLPRGGCDSGGFLGLLPGGSGRTVRGDEGSGRGGAVPAE